MMYITYRFCLYVVVVMSAIFYMIGIIILVCVCVYI